MSSTSISRKFTDQQLLEGLWADDYEILKVIYSRFLPQVVSFVQKNGGSTAEAEDVFQDALVVVFKKKEADFILSSTLGTYISGVSRFIWLRQLRKKDREIRVTSAHTEGLSDTEALETALLGVDKRRLFREKLSELGDKCQRVLRMFFARVPLAEIAKKLGYTPDYIKKKNRTCKAKLTQLIQKDYRYRDLS